MHIRVAIVEDESRLRATLTAMIEETADMRCVAQYASAEAVLRSFPPAGGVDVVLVDINLPGRSGIELVNILKNRHARLHLVMMTVFEDADQIFQSLQAGATGYLLKRAHPDEIRNAIRDVLRGGSPMSPEIARKVVLFFHHRGAETAELETLTDRENEVLSCLAKGFMYKEIADRLNVSLDTVRTHLQHIYQKLHVRTRTDAVLKFLNAKGADEKS
jgi:DNA-binding NarL/FixJ family response regulator